MWKILSSILLIAAPLDADEVDWQAQVQEINMEVRELEDRRIKLLGQANRLEDKAIRWQFMQNQTTEAKRAFKQADAYRQEAGMIQAQIDLLERRKQKIIEQNKP